MLRFPARAAVSWVDFGIPYLLAVPSGLVARLKDMSRGETASSPSRPLEAATVTALRSTANRFGGADRARKLALLRAAAGGALCDMGVLLAYHDVLLFLIAYPEAAAVRTLASRELARVVAATREIAARGSGRARTRLRGSGVAWSTITIAYSYPIARWLVSRYLRCAEVDSIGEGGALLAQWLRHALPPAEFELLESADETPERLLEAATTGWRSSRLAWLIAQFERLPCDPALREAAYDSLHVFVTLNPRDAVISRTFARGSPAVPFYHRGPFLRDVDADRLIATPLPPAQHLRRTACQQLLDAGRAVLAMLGRETDPITHADVARTRYCDLGRGVAIALFSAIPARRDPLDSHIGYVLFKNSVPVGYGGGWPFLGSCKIGINIFAPFRGGESTFLMASVLRAYAQLFAVERFVVEPYQFGAGQPRRPRIGRLLVLFSPWFPTGRVQAARGCARRVRADATQSQLSDVAVGAAALHALGSRASRGPAGAGCVRSRGAESRDDRVDWGSLLRTTRSSGSRRPIGSGRRVGAQGRPWLERRRAPCAARDGARTCSDLGFARVARARQAPPGRADPREGWGRVPLFRTNGGFRTAA